MFDTNIIKLIKKLIRQKTSIFKNRIQSLYYDLIQIKLNKITIKYNTDGVINHKHYDNLLNISTLWNVIISMNLSELYLIDLYKCLYDNIFKQLLMNSVEDDYNDGSSNDDDDDDSNELINHQQQQQQQSEVKKKKTIKITENEEEKVISIVDSESKSDDFSYIYIFTY